MGELGGFRASVALSDQVLSPFGPLWALGNQTTASEDHVGSGVNELEPLFTTCSAMMASRDGLTAFLRQSC